MTNPWFLDFQGFIFYSYRHIIRGIKDVGYSAIL